MPNEKMDILESKVLEWMIKKIKMGGFQTTYSRQFNNLPKYLIFKNKNLINKKYLLNFFGEIINYFKKKT